MRNSDAFETLVEVLRNGGLAVYPTETLYAVGCRADMAESVRAVSVLKARPQAKPLPLVIGGMDELAGVCGEVGPVTRKLMDRFWPGPLSILVPAVESLAPGVSDDLGRTSVRWTDHPVAAQLCTMVGPRWWRRAPTAAGANPRPYPESSTRKYFRASRPRSSTSLIRPEAAHPPW